MNPSNYYRNISTIDGQEANYLTMKGIILKETIKNSGIKIKTIAKESGIPEQTIYSLYKKKEVDDSYIQRLRLTVLGKYLPSVTSESITPTINSTVNEESPTQYSRIPSEGAWDQAMAAINRLIDMVGKDNEAFRKIITTGLEKEALIFSPKKAGITQRDLP